MLHVLPFSFCCSLLLVLDALFEIVSNGTAVVRTVALHNRAFLGLVWGKQNSVWRALIFNVAGLSKGTQLYYQHIERACFFRWIKGVVFCRKGKQNISIWSLSRWNCNLCSAQNSPSGNWCGILCPSLFIQHTIITFTKIECLLRLLHM